MPAFDPVRDAVLNSPIDSPSFSPIIPRRATDLSMLLNDNGPPAHTHQQHRHSTIHSLLQDDTLAAAEPIRRSTMDIKHISPQSSRAYPQRGSPRPSSASTSDSQPPPRSSTSPAVVPKSTLPYKPNRRITKADSVLVPLSSEEMDMYRNYRGQGVARLTGKRKRALSEEPVEEVRPAKRHTGDVAAVVQHYNSRPDVGVVQRMESPIIGLKAFNNWVKSVLITRFAHPALEKSSFTRSNGGQGFGRGKVLDMGCGKGGDISKWTKARVGEVLFCDIAAVSIEQAHGRWKSNRGHRFDASFAALDCYAEPLIKGFPPAKLSTPVDVVSMQFCMHYAFEKIQKVRCMLDNVSKYLRPGGVFIGTIPNAELLLEQLDHIPPDEEDKSFGNSVYKITFDNRSGNDRPIYGHKYSFFLEDAVENVPEYVVHWDNFVQLASEYGLVPIYKEEFHQVFQEHQEHPEFKPLLVKMKVVDAQGESAMDEDQWEAANIYIAFAFEKR
ncbi:mRNA capping enzyme-domain-containing protein [Crepidotus variabilis]|uniref:mRNA cap guanine-N(7) methyltransferase n=1 Tax=Crepidotus variabilis TaxID=179855 RepID=A0A9P6EQ82_9AGAR|nr:mRNA capping enzyme-domain-containing protein [Crepidotus variabilis]